MANIVNKTKPVRNLVVFTIFFLTAFIFVPVGRAADDIILDGAFADWVGQSGITDPVGDASRPFDDLTGFYFATNPDDSTAYFMAERVSSNSPLNLVLLIDTNDDGVLRRSRRSLYHSQLQPPGQQLIRRSHGL